MARKIKKITKRAVVSFFWLGAFAVSLFARFGAGDGSSNFFRDKKTESSLNGPSFISSAHADISVTPGCTSGTCGVSGGS